MRYIYLLAFLIITAPLQGQHWKDSLTFQLEQVSTPKAKIRTLDELAWRLKYSSSKEAVNYIEQGLGLTFGENEMHAIGLYNTLGIILRQENQIDRAIQTYGKAIELAKRHNQVQSQCAAHVNLGVLYKHKEMFDSAIWNYERAINLAAKLDSATSNKIITSTKINIATIQSERGFKLDALNEYKELEKILEHTSQKHQLAVIYHNIGGIYEDIANLDMAKYYFQRSRDLELEMNNLKGLSISLISLGIIYTQTYKSDSALVLVNEGIRLQHQLGIIEELPRSYRALGEYYASFGNFEKAAEEWDKSIMYSRKTGHVRSLATALIKTAEASIYTMHLQKVLPKLEEADKLIIDFEINGLYELFYATKFKYQVAINRMPQAFLSLAQYDSFFLNRINQEKIGSVLEIETKYETAKKDKEILQLENTQQAQEITITKNRITQYSLAGVLISLLLAGGFFWKDRQRRLLLEKYKAEEAEKNRIARELHDGIANELHKIGESLPKESTKLKERLLETDRELRKFAHQLETKRKFESSMADILNDYIGHGRFEEKLDIKVDFFPRTFDIENHELKLNIFRIWQELISNTIKHSHADQCFFQLAFSGKKIEVTYKDNGSGIVSDNKGEGIGLHNIQERVNLMKGKIDFSSSEDGFGVSIEMPVKKSHIKFI